MEQNKRTQIAELGEFGLIDKLTGAFAPRNRTTLRGVGDDAAVIAASRSEATLVSTDLLMEGIDFDLTYFPLKHLGYKTVTVGASDILAMNCCCRSACRRNSRSRRCRSSTRVSAWLARS